MENPKKSQEGQQQGGRVGVNRPASPVTERGMGGRTKVVPSGGASGGAAATRGSDPRAMPDLAMDMCQKTHQTARGFEKDGSRGQG